MSGFNIFEVQGGYLKSILATDEDELDELMDSITMNSDIADIKTEALESYLRDNKLNAAFVADLKVESECQGQGVGKKLMDLFENKVSTQSDIKILIARTMNKQSNGFDLESFYEKRGFKGLLSEYGDLLMVSKEHHTALEVKMNLKEERALIIDWYEKNEPKKESCEKMLEFAKKRTKELNQEEQKNKRSRRIKPR